MFLFAERCIFEVELVEVLDEAERGRAAAFHSRAALRQRELAQLQGQRADLEVRSKLLRDGQISRDLVEERARYLLGFSDPRDYVIRTRP